MIKLYSNIIGTPILHFEEGSLLGVVKDLIVHPDTGKLEALWVKPAGQLLGYAVLQTQDIVEWKKNLYVRDATVFSDPTEIIKIADILSDGRQIIGNRVRTESGEALGRVADIDFDTEQYYLHHLYTQKSFLGFWAFDRRILSYDLILEVLPDTIVIKDKTEKKEAIKKTLIEENPTTA